MSDKATWSTRHSETHNTHNMDTTNKQNVDVAHNTGHIDARINKHIKHQCNDTQQLSNRCNKQHTKQICKKTTHFSWTQHMKH